MSRHYGPFGGVFAPEVLQPSLEALEKEWKEVCASASFQTELASLLNEYGGRPTPLTEISRFAAVINGPTILLKREDLLHTGAHKLNNALGQCLLAKRMGKTRVFAETGAGQHGVATATACARLGLKCEIYMSQKNAKKVSPNVMKMQLLGAKVVVVAEGSSDDAAFQNWCSSFETSHYCLGSALGPYPYPEMVATFQGVIGQETKQQMWNRFGQNPDYIIACIGGGSNAIGIFSAFLEDKDVQLIGVEGGGEGKKMGQHAARFQGGKPGVLHGCYTYVLQNEQGEVSPTTTISAGLDYPAIGPQHAFLHDTKRVLYTSVTDEQALYAFKLLSQTEGIIPALESSHALAFLCEKASTLPKDAIVVVNLSGRGDKDLPALKEKGFI